MRHGHFGPLKTMCVNYAFLFRVNFPIAESSFIRLEPEINNSQYLIHQEPETRNN